MNLPELQVTLQAVSSFGITAGLIFTAIQFRAYRKAQHVANFAKLVEMQAHLREMRVNDPKLAAVYRHDVEHTHSEREVREYFFNLMQLSVFEIVWFARRHGQVPEDYFRSWEGRMRDIVSEESFRAMMASPSMKFMHDEFQTYISGMMATVASSQRQATIDS
jgi:hypothetical protein